MEIIAKFKIWFADEEVLIKLKEQFYYVEKDGEILRIYKKSD